MPQHWLGRTGQCSFPSSFSFIDRTKDYQNDKYENFFLNLKAFREGQATFAGFTATATVRRINLN